MNAPSATARPTLTTLVLTTPNTNPNSSPDTRQVQQYPTLPSPAERAALYQTAQQNQQDLAILPHGLLQPSAFKLLAMDMDSTVITIECIDELADFAGKKTEVAAITEAAMRGEITDFSQSLQRRVALLAGTPAASLEAVYRERLRFSPGAHALVHWAKQQGWATLLVSGGFTFFTERVQAELGLDQTQANTLEIVDGKITGRVLGPIVDGPAKARAVAHTCAALSVDSQAAVVMGDGANDLPMMRIAGLSVAYHAKPAVQEEAQQRIVLGGLDTVCAWFDGTRG